MSNLIDLSVMERRGDYSEQFTLTEQAPRIQDPKGSGKSFQPDMMKIMFFAWDEGWKVNFAFLGGRMILADGTVGKKRLQLDYSDPLDPDHVEEDRAPEWVREIIEGRLALLQGKSAVAAQSAPEGAIEILRINGNGKHTHNQHGHKTVAVPVEVSGRGNVTMMMLPEVCSDLYGAVCEE